MQVEYFSCDGKANTGTLGCADMFLIHFIISVPDIIQLIFWNTFPKVLYFNFYIFVRDNLTDDDMSAVTGIVDGIDHKVIEYLFNALAVSIDCHMVTKMHINIKVVLVVLYIIFALFGLNHFRNIKWCFIEGNLVFLHTGKIEKIIDEVVKPL